MNKKFSLNPLSTTGLLIQFLIGGCLLITYVRTNPQVCDLLNAKDTYMEKVLLLCEVTTKLHVKQEFIITYRLSKSLWIIVWPKSTFWPLQRNFYMFQLGISGALFYKKLRSILSLISIWILPLKSTVRSILSLCETGPRLILQLISMYRIHQNQTYDWS